MQLLFYFFWKIKFIEYVIIVTKVKVGWVSSERLEIVIPNPLPKKEIN